MAKEWPLMDSQVSELAATKYSDVFEVHHYKKMPEMIVMDYDFLLENYGIDYTKTVTNLEYEESVNEFKKLIRVIKPQYITAFTDRFKAALING